MVTRTFAPTYAGLLAAAARQALFDAAWVLTGELPAARRRLARAGLTATVATLHVGVSAFLEPPSENAGNERPAWADDLVDDEIRDGDEDASDEEQQDGEDEPADPIADESGQPGPGAEEPGTELLLMLGSSMLLVIGSSWLRKRWRASLTRSPHPHRALALRTAALSFVVSLLSDLLVRAALDARPDPPPARSGRHVRSSRFRRDRDR